MGSDLSIVLQPCVPVPEYISAAHEKQLCGAALESNNTVMWYTQLRLVECNTFLTQVKSMQSDGVVPPVSSHVLVGECTPQALISLDLCDTKLFQLLHSELCCGKCAGKIGLAVDSSVGIGYRLYDAEQRHLFAQCFSMFLSKFVLAIKSVTAAINDKSSSKIPDCRVQVSDDLVISQPNSPSNGGTYMLHELFLVDLQSCFLDDVSGPWIVRDIMDHMGSVQHHHTAVSMVSSLKTSSLLLRSTQTTTLGSPCSSRMLVCIPTRDDVSEVALPDPDPMEIDFCRSLSYVILMHNNMSIVGIQKCITELINSNGKEETSHPLCIKMIDVRQNEESMAAQRLVAGISLVTNVQILIGTSGKRWRHRLNSQFSGSRDNVSPITTKYPSLMHSSFELSRSNESNRLSTVCDGGVPTNGENTNATLRIKGDALSVVQSKGDNAAMEILEDNILKKGSPSHSSRYEGRKKGRGAAVGGSP